MNLGGSFEPQVQMTGGGGGMYIRRLHQGGGSFRTFTPGVMGTECCQNDLSQLD